VQNCLKITLGILLASYFSAVFTNAPCLQSAHGFFLPAPVGGSTPDRGFIFLRDFKRIGVSRDAGRQMKCLPISDGNLNCQREADPSLPQNMNIEDIQLQTLLRESRARLPLPPRFQQNVWRRIENAETAATPTGWLDALGALVLRPRFALAAVAALMLIGILAGVQQGREAARHDAQMNYLTAVAPHSVP
jgi:hypothetical protein